MKTSVLILGGGLAAVRTAQALRDLKFDGDITIVSNENHLPYDRPPLSKSFLLGTASDKDIRLITEERLEQLSIRFLAGRQARSIDPDAGQARFADGQTIEFEHLVVATGATPIAIPFVSSFANAHSLRSMEDALALREAFQPGSRIGIVGGGFIGLEIASVAAGLGAVPIVIEAAATPLAPVLGATLGGYIQRWHERRGVRFECGKKLVSAHGDSHCHTLELETGHRIEVDSVVVGVGARPNTACLDGSGLQVHVGLVCDPEGRSSHPKVFGVGDVVCCHYDGACHPTRHWTLTGEQARRVAGLIAGKPEPGPFIDDHYFWSDQHGVRMQFAGTVAQDAQIRFVVGGPDEDKFVVQCLSHDEVTGVFSLGSPRDFILQSMPLRKGA